MSSWLREWVVQGCRGALHLSDVYCDLIPLGSGNMVVVFGECRCSGRALYDVLGIVTMES